MVIRSNNPHEIRSLQNHLQDTMRRSGIQYGERNFLGNRDVNNAGVAKGGALQGKRYAGTYNTNTETQA